MKKLTYLLVLTFSIVSCNDFLDKNPDNRANLEDPENIAELLVSAYPAYSHVWFSELMSDNTMDVGTQAPNNDEETRQSYYWERVGSESQDSPDGFWYSCYEAIASANHALDAIKKLEEEGKYTARELNPIKGEALMCRAFNHFMLVNLFAEHYDPLTAATTPGIPYVTEPETKPISDYTRQSVQEVYTAIENDMLAGFPLIEDETYKSAPKWHFNLKAAATFISRYYLYRALPEDWNKVIYYADLAVEGNPKGFLRDWLGTYDWSLNAFGINYSRSTNFANFLIISNVSTGTRAWSYRYSMDLELARKRGGYGEPHPTQNSITGLYVFNEKLGGSSTGGCYAIVKFSEEFRRDGVNANYGVPYVMYTPLVAEEAMFNQMEAEVMKENYTKVIGLLDLYYSTRVLNYDLDKYKVTDAVIKAKYTGNSNSPEINPHFIMNPTQKIYMKCIVNIRASEFVSEGQRWFDIKRMHIPVIHNVVGGTPMLLTKDDVRRVIPLPEDVGKLPFDSRTTPIQSEGAPTMSTYSEIMKNLGLSQEFPTVQNANRFNHSNK